MTRNHYIVLSLLLLCSGCSDDSSVFLPTVHVPYVVRPVGYTTYVQSPPEPRYFVRPYVVPAYTYFSPLNSCSSFYTSYRYHPSYTWWYPRWQRSGVFHCSVNRLPDYYSAVANSVESLRQTSANNLTAFAGDYRVAPGKLQVACNDERYKDSAAAAVFRSISDKIALDADADGAVSLNVGDDIARFDGSSEQARQLRTGRKITFDQDDRHYEVASEIEALFEAPSSYVSPRAQAIVMSGVSITDKSGGRGNCLVGWDARFEAD